MTYTLKKLLALLLTLCSLLPCAALADEPVTLRLPDLRSLDEAILASYTAETGVRFEEIEAGDIMETMANAFAIRNDQIDLFVFTAYAGLFAIKEHNYYAPLDDSAVMAQRVADLYPAFQKALTDEGRIVGWMVNVQPMTFNINERIMEENNLPVPATFGELLDICKALDERGVLDQRTIPSMSFPYSSEGMLNLFMEEYIRACSLNGGIVDFTRPEFAAMAERIRDEVPRTAEDIDWELFEDEVFYYPAVRENIYEGMTAFPRVLSDQSSAVMTYATVMTVNPYAAHRDEAIAFLEYYADHDRMGYAYDASLTEPLKNEYNAQRLLEIETAITTLERINEPTAAQRDEIADLEAERALCEQYLWRVTEADIAYYRDFVQNIAIEEGSPVSYDQVLQAAAGRFLSGAYDGAGFARACQEHIAMIYQEHGIPME